MSNAAVSNTVLRIDDPRLAAFLSANSPEIFHSVATPADIAKADPFDVETIHAEAREEFERLLHRGSRDILPPSGSVLVLQGEAGSGKTHLMRAFRTRTHSQGWGYCGYLQMTTEASNYARYILNNLIDGLEQTYSPDGTSSGTALSRLSAALLEAVPNLTRADHSAFREGDRDPTEWVDEYADRLYATQRFRACDLALLRTLLHLERHEPRVHSRALMWLRCEAMRTQDCAWIGNAIPKTDDADPMRMLCQLATVIRAVHHVPLVLLIDQLEDIANQSDPVERFLKVVDAVTALTDGVPNAIVVMACLEDYFKVHADKLIKAKQDRLVRDPEPIRLRSNRSLEEIQEMVRRRLTYLYDTAEAEATDGDELFPFRQEHLQPLENLRSRDVLDFLRRHHQQCMSVGKWVEPNEVSSSMTDASRDDPRDLSTLDAEWNTYHSQFEAAVPDEEEELIAILADAIRRIDPELSDGLYCECEQDGRFLEVEKHATNNHLDQRLVALCNANTRGPSFAKQLTELEERAGDIPVAIVRTTEFPKSGKAIKQIAGMLKRQGDRVVVADADWRRMLAFGEFAKWQIDRPDFDEWQRTARPLSELASLQRILRLNAGSVTATPQPLAAEQPTIAAPAESNAAKHTAVERVVPPDSTMIVLGSTTGLRPEPVTFDPNELTQHAAFLGGSGSGKTTAALNLIEQLLARGTPAVLVDRKGDLCRYADPEAWMRSLGDPSRDDQRARLRDMLDVAVFTPGEPSGRPLTIPLTPPGFDQLSEADRERFAQYAAGALGSMIGFKSSDADKGQRAILAKAIETLASLPGATVDAPALRELIKSQDDILLNSIGGAYPEKYYNSLSERLLTLELSNRPLLTGGEALDIDALLGTGQYARPGRARLSVISTRFLGDAGKVDFWVSQLLVALSRWCAKSPQPQLQAVFMFDEADIYLPAGNRQPATKAPMEDLLKRARSAGVGIFLATQSPGDFDYKCKENVRTWLIGNVKQPQALRKLKPLFAAAKGAVEEKLAGQAPGEFFLVRESSVSAVRSDQSFVSTHQMAEHEIAEVARGTVGKARSQPIRAPLRASLAGK